MTCQLPGFAAGYSSSCQTVVAVIQGYAGYCYRAVAGVDVVIGACAAGDTDGVAADDTVYIQVGVVKDSGITLVIGFRYCGRLRCRQGFGGDLADVAAEGGRR